MAERLIPRNEMYINLTGEHPVAHLTQDQGIIHKTPTHLMSPGLALETPLIDPDPEDFNHNRTSHSEELAPKRTKVEHSEPVNEHVDTQVPSRERLIQPYPEAVSKQRVKKISPRASESEHIMTKDEKDKADEDLAQKNALLIQRYKNEGLPDELALKPDGLPIEWSKLALPEKLWQKALKQTDEMFQHRTIRQTQRRRLIIFCAIILIVARKANLPRTFSEVCTVTETTKKDVGSTYKLILTILQTEEGTAVRPTPHIDVGQLIHRWCSGLNLPTSIIRTIVELNEACHQKGITHTRCPTSACAASIWFVVSSLNAQREKLIREDPGLEDLPDLSCSQMDVLREAGVVLATLNGVMKLIVPHAEELLPVVKMNHLLRQLQPIASSPVHHGPVPSPIPETVSSPLSDGPENSRVSPKKKLDKSEGSAEAGFKKPLD
ncbi:transcription initiation factor IIB [Entomophthora muscae]|uniref:Transcription initiation factor IIB n=1 Tax=Entomophthora muscae TaxID=34485 RepID=A0ACC2RWD4_9FUNG|nr:transcription initiation factor IIB [Entomophthora muscae]